MRDWPRFPSFPDPICWWARVAPERVALVDRTRDLRLSYNALDQLADAWAAALLRSGVRQGDRVATLARNRPAHVALLFAAWRVGAALVPFNWRLAPPELARIAGHARARVVVGDGCFQSLAESADVEHAGTRWVELGEDHEGPPVGTVAHRAHSPRSVAPDEPALILYTSGSTGAPKGAMIPHRQLFFNAMATTIGWELSAADVAPVATPFFHTAAWNVFAYPLWSVGGRVVLFEQFDPDAFLAGLASEACTVAFAVPTQLVMLLESRAWGQTLPSLRWIISGGAPCPISVIERVRAGGVRIKEGYGLTECGPNCFVAMPDETLHRPGSVGRPIPFLETRVTRDAGGSADAGEPGELLLRGPQMFAGYWDDAARTAEAVDDEGWLRTGDLVSREEDGTFRIRGRKKEMYISGGENVFPAEVEQTFALHPAVSEVAVIGVPDAKWGEVGRAFVVLRGAVPNDELLAFARTRLAGYKVPKSIVFVDILPRLGSGKVDRVALAGRHETPPDVAQRIPGGAPP